MKYTQEKLTEYLETLDVQIEESPELILVAKRAEIRNVLMILQLADPEDDLSEVISRATKLLIDPSYLGNHQRFHDELSVPHSHIINKKVTKTA